MVVKPASLETTLLSVIGSSMGDVAAGGVVDSSKDAISAILLASLPTGDVGSPSLNRPRSLDICFFMTLLSSCLLAALSSNFSFAPSSGALAAFCTPINVDEGLVSMISGSGAAAGVSRTDGAAACGTIDVAGTAGTTCSGFELPHPIMSGLLVFSLGSRVLGW